jgi:glycosyltransferase involved in cell wall biosynthesis
VKPLAADAGHKFSVVIPCRNEAANIRQCIEAVLSNVKADDKDTGCEVIVIDDGSTDGAPDIIRDLGVRLIENHDKSKTIGALRNIGARQTSGSVILFLDADVVIPNDCLKKAKEYFDEGFAGALGFVDNAPQDAGWVGRVWGTRIYQGLDRVVDVSFLSGRNIFINRRVFEEINGFDETLRTNEDKDMTMRVKRAGYSLISIPETGLLHLGYEKSLREFIRKEFWRQGSSLAAAMSYGLSLKTLRHPFLSLFHIAMPFMIAFFLILSKLELSIALLIAWLFPSAVIAVKKLSPAAPFGFRLGFFFLTFLRWNVSGAALLKQAAVLLSGGKDVKHK